MKKKPPQTKPRALILAEGGNLKLRPLTEHLPTCLVPVGGTPILDSQIQTLKQRGLGDITVLGGYRAAQVEQACRSYPGVRFRFNPDYSRTGARLGSLRAADLEPQGGLLLISGNLIFDGSVVQELLDRWEEDLFLTDGDGHGIGLIQLSAGSLESVFSACERVTAKGGSASELLPFVESFLRDHEGLSLEIGERPWARVETMEDLARALKAYRGSVEAQVAAQEALQRALAEPLTASSEADRPQQAGADPVPASRAPERASLGRPLLLVRPLLRALNR